MAFDLPVKAPYTKNGIDEAKAKQNIGECNKELMLEAARRDNAPYTKNGIDETIQPKHTSFV
jgi:hypothetical protein